MHRNSKQQAAERRTATMDDDDVEIIEFDAITGQQFGRRPNNNPPKTTAAPKTAVLKYQTPQGRQLDYNALPGGAPEKKKPQRPAVGEQPVPSQLVQLTDIPMKVEPTVVFWPWGIRRPKITEDEAEEAQEGGQRKTKKKPPSQPSQLVGGRRAPNMNLIRRLTPEWINYIGSIMAGQRKGYIKTVVGRINTEELTNHLLLPGSNLSINIMTVALSYIASAANQHYRGDANEPKVVAIPFKWYKMYVLDKYLNKAEDGLKSLDEDCDIRPENFDKIQYIIIPILRGSHWTLGVICPRIRGIAHLNSEWPLDPDENISQLRYILQLIMGPDYNAQEWGLLPWFYYSPRQACEGDSGVCAIANAECVVMGVNPRESWDPIDVRDHKRLMVGALLLCKDYSMLVRMKDI